MDSILVVDDEKSMCDFLSIMLEKEGYTVRTAQEGLSALELLKENVFDVVITDIKMPKSNGIEVLEAVNEHSPNTPVVMMTAYASAETAVEAMKKGAYDYISKPFNVEDLLLIIKNAAEKKKLFDENVQLKIALEDKYRFNNLIGNGSAMKKVFEMIQKVIHSNATVLITGESGTGKELVAKAIHYNGLMHEYPFVSINCGAMPENLLESELFGHEKGAYTSADSVKVGLMETANKGSFFLDEIAEAPLSIQVKLLRVLQEREFTRVGGTQPIKVDLRIITATNQDLELAVENKTFRKDLYYRLNVIPIHLPSLRQRKEDIPLLVNFFIKKYNDQHHRETPVKGIHPEAMSVLEKYQWPGNVRELENVIERAVVLEPGELIQVSSLPKEIFKGPKRTHDLIPNLGNQPVDLEKTLDQIEKNLILDAMDQSNGMINKAARLLNLSFRSMRYRLQKHNVKGKMAANRK